MSPQGLASAHAQEQDPSLLLDSILADVPSELFERGRGSADAYSDLEDFSIFKSAQPSQHPYVVASSSLEAARLCKDVFTAQHATHLAKVMIKPPQAPEHPTSSIVDDCSPGSLDEVRKKLKAGIAAAPKGCHGLPSQCQDWEEMPACPSPRLRSDFSLLSKNIGTLRRSGYMHACSSTQLTCINALPGPVSVKYLVLMSILLGQPLLTRALPLDMTQPKLVPQGTANPQPLSTWHPHADFTQQLYRMGNTDVKMLLGFLPAIQITLPTTQRKLLRVDRVADLAELSALQHNALRWTASAMRDTATITSDQFRLIDGIPENVEYLLHPHPLSAKACLALAHAKHGRLPVTQVEVAFATAAVSWPQMLWTATNQVSPRARTHGYEYTLTLEDRQLLPSTPASPPCTILHMIGGRVQEIREDHIGSHYLWYQNSGKGNYHAYSPWRLTASLATNGSCKVYVPLNNQALTPDAYLNRCLVLRNGSLAAVHRQQLHSAISLQHDRLAAIKGLPAEVRLQNHNRTLGPLSVAAARLIPRLQTGEDQFLLDASPAALQVGIRRTQLAASDFRRLTTNDDGLDPLPTPSALLSLGSTMITTAGSFVVSSLTQDMVSKAMSRILAGGKYKFLDPLLIRSAAAAADRSTYVHSFNTKEETSYNWSEDGNILLLRDLKSLGHLPPDVAQDQAQLASGLAVVTGAAQALEDFNHKGLEQLEKIALSFLSSSDLHIDNQAGGLVYVVRSGSTALISYFLSTLDPAPALQSHRFHALPAFHGKTPGTSIILDLPKHFTLTHQAATINISATQSTCARALASGEYETALGQDHPACFTTVTKAPMMQVIYQQGSDRLIQTASPPGRPMTAFLACAGQHAHRFTLHSEINVFAVPGSCSIDFSVLQSKLASVDRLTSEQGESPFGWLISFNTSIYSAPLTAQEELHIALYSILGSLSLAILAAAGLALKYKDKLPCLKTSLPASSTYVGFERATKATIFHPHLGPRSLSDFSSDEEATDSPALQHGSASSHIRPASIRARAPLYAPYSATVKRTSKPFVVDAVRVPHSVQAELGRQQEKESTI